MENSKKYQIFIARTQLKSEVREKIIENIINSGNFFTEMKYFTTNHVPNFKLVEKEIIASDAVFMFLSGRYGSSPVDSEISYIHHEYDVAMKNKKPLYVFSLKKELKLRRRENDTKHKKYKKFKDSMKDSWIFNCYNLDDIARTMGAATADLSKLSSVSGWQKRKSWQKRESQLLSEIEELKSQIDFLNSEKKAIGKIEMNNFETPLPPGIIGVRK